MQTTTLAEVMRNKALSHLPVLDYREENGKAFIEVQLRTAKPAPMKPLYNPKKMIAILRAGRIDLGFPTNATQDIRRERNSSPAKIVQRQKSKRR